MRIEYDKEARAAYIYLRKGKTTKTIKLMDSLLVDIGEKNNILGIEVLGGLPFNGKVKANLKIPVTVK